MVRQQSPAMTVLHDMGRLMSQHNPDLPGVILEIVSAQQQGIAGGVERPQQCCRTVLGHQGVGARPTNQGCIASDPLPGLGPGCAGEERGNQAQNHCQNHALAHRHSETQHSNTSSPWSHSRHAGSNWQPWR